MNEEENMILDDGFDDLPVEEPQADTQDILDNSDTETVEEPTNDSTETVNEEQVTPQMLKIKVDREEREISVEEAAILAQKGWNYDRAVERARVEAAQQARDSVIADMGYTWNGNPITTETQYKQAMAEQELINKYKDRDLPDEVIKELVESKRDREERAEEKRVREQEAKRQGDFEEFFKYFESVNGRTFDPVKDKVSPEVDAAVRNGQPLKYAYMEHHNKVLQDQLKISKQNEANVKKSPIGSVTANGSAKTLSKDPFLEGFMD